MGTASAQGELWSGSPRDWAEFQEPLCTPLFNAVLDAAGVAAGQRVLDVGCGSGLFCHLAAQRGAQVAGVDAATGMLDIAKSRTPDGDFHIGEMEELQFGDDTFDLVAGFNSFQFAADPVNALRQAKRVAKPNGKVSMAIWGIAQDCQAASVLKAQARLLPPPPPGAPGPFALSERGRLEALLLQAGLKAGPAMNVDTPFTFATMDAGCRGFMASGPGMAAVRRNGEEKVRATLSEALAPFKQPDGSYRLENTFKFAIASA